jgi:Putative MetA-pathway of phenol degradation
MARGPMLSPIDTRHALMLLALGVCASASAQAPSDDQPSVTPYRPSVSTPAALSAPGYLELEAGGLRERDGGAARTDSLPYTLKLAFTPDWGVRIGGDAWIRQRDDTGQSLSGVGDTSLVLKRRFEMNDTSALGLEAGATFPTARHGLGSGKTDTSVVGIYSADLGAYHTDVNLGLTRVGAVDPGTSRAQTLWAASLSRSFLERWGVVGEFSGTHQRGVDSTSQFLLAASYNVSKSLTLDAGFAHSLRSGVSDRSVFAGFTALGPRVFGPPP